MAQCLLALCEHACAYVCVCDRYYPDIREWQSTFQLHLQPLILSFSLPISNEEAGNDFQYELYSRSYWLMFSPNQKSVLK